MNAYRSGLIENLRNMYRERWSHVTTPTLTVDEAETILRVIGELEKAPMGHNIPRQAQYNVIELDEAYVLIEDLDGPLSVTNDAERVVKELLVQYPHRRFYYIDTMGNRDELCHDGKSFTHFAPARGVCLS